MFFRSVKVVKKFSLNYLKLSAAGSAAGGVLGATGSLIVSPVIFGEAFNHSPEKSNFKKMADATTTVVETTAVNTAAMMYLGAFPVTYPLSKIYSHFADQNEVPQNNRSSISRRP